MRSTFSCSVSSTECPIDQAPEDPAPDVGTVVSGQPNVLVIQFDDLGFADWQSQGFGLARTPTMSRLAREGLVARRYFTGSTVCSPSRYTMATGRDSAEDGVFTTMLTNDISNAAYNNIHGLPINMPTIYDQFGQLGYKTGHFGKWHMGFDPTQIGLGDETLYGIDEIRGWAFHESPIPEASDQAVNQASTLQWYQDRDARMAQGVINFTNTQTVPWFVNWSLHAPHHPLYPSAAGLAAVSHLGVSTTVNDLDPNDDRSINDFMRYYAAIWDADKLIGDVYNSLRDSGQLENTIIIVTSDNGPANTELVTTATDQEGRVGSFKGVKGTTYNGGVRVPFVARGPSIPTGVELTKASIGAVDIMPTLIHMVGGSPPAAVDGEIMTARLQGQDVDRTTPLHWLTIQSLPISIHNADRSPNIRGYYPAGTVGNATPWNVYNNTPDNTFIRDAELYKNDDDREARNYLYEMSGRAACRDIMDGLLQANLDWYASLDNPRLRAGSGRVTHEL